MRGRVIALIAAKSSSFPNHQLSPPLYRGPRNCPPPHPSLQRRTWPLPAFVHPCLWPKAKDCKKELCSAGACTFPIPPVGCSTPVHFPRCATTIRQQNSLLIWSLGTFPSSACHPFSQALGAQLMHIAHWSQTISPALGFQYSPSTNLRLNPSLGPLLTFPCKILKVTQFAGVLPEPCDSCHRCLYSAITQPVWDVQVPIIDL